MRHSRRLAAPINTIKHYVQRSKTATTSGALATIVVVDAVIDPDTGPTFDVRQGSVIKAIYFEYWVLSQGATGTFAQFNLIIEKVPSGLASVTAAQLNNLQAYDNKKNVLYATQAIIGAGVDGQGAIPMVKGWQLIPKGKQRMGLGDRIVVSFTPTAQTEDTCGFATYKEWT